MTVSQKDKALRFQALHQAPGYFVIPNPWDGASARILAGLGFLALATSSGAQAGTLGRRDGKVKRDEALAHARAIVTATDLPVSADLEKGFGDAPAAAAETIRLAAEVGLVGGSIEDATGDRDRPLYDVDQATERVAAAVEAARKLPFPFTLTARSENFLRGNPSLDDTIQRLQAFERAGADVLFAPGLPDLNAVRTVCAAVSQALQLHGRDQGQVLHGGRAGRGRREAHQPGRLALPGGDERPARRRPRGEGQGHLRVRGPRGLHPRPQRLPAGVKTAAQPRLAVRLRRRRRLHRLVHGGDHPRPRGVRPLLRGAFTPGLHPAHQELPILEAQVEWPALRGSGADDVGDARLQRGRRALVERGENRTHLIWAERDVSNHSELMRPPLPAHCKRSWLGAALSAPFDLEDVT